MTIPSISVLQQLWHRLFKSARSQPRRKLGLLTIALAAAALGITSTLVPPALKASDHDDGDIDIRSRALSLTDLYVFREKDQNANAREDDLILVMNTNPRSLARQQYYFSTQARYDFRVSRVANKDAAPTGTPDATLRFTFSAPDSQNRQRITITTSLDGGRTKQVYTATTSGQPIYTTPLAANPNTPPTLNQVAIGDSVITVFSGLREDPFFFDVEQYFRVRAGLAGLGPAAGFRPVDKAVDFAKGYNVNSIVVRVPRRLLQGKTNATTFDVWLALMSPDPKTRRFVQTEQLARPGINELLTTSRQEIYALYNQTQPSINRPEIRNDIRTVLRAVGNSDARANVLVNAFLPDVMRIDTTGASGYGNALNQLGAPIRGRKLLDDVVDISLSVVTNGAVTTDNVSYQGTPGNPAQGHQPLSPAFPYLALPN